MVGVQNDARERADTGALSREEGLSLFFRLVDEGDGDRLVRRWRVRRRIRAAMLDEAGPLTVLLIS